MPEFLSNRDPWFCSHREHRLFRWRDPGTIDSIQLLIQGLQPRFVGGTAFVHILYNPSESIRGLDLPEVGPDRQPGGNAPNRLMEESRVAGPEAPHEIMHGQFEGLRVGYGNNTLALALRAFGPAGSVERRIEVVLENCALRFIEDFGALFPAQLPGSVERFF